MAKHIFKKGELIPATDDHMATAGIDKIEGPGLEHFSAIECHGQTEGIAQRLRDRVLVGLSLTDNAFIKAHIEDLNSLIALLHRQKEGGFAICSEAEEMADELIANLSTFKNLPLG